MFSGRSSAPINWLTFLDYLYLHGEPTFTVEEAMQVWDYIVAHVPASCLMERVE
jgi:hypothetical protein